MSSLGKGGELRGGGQLALDEEEGDLGEGAGLGELLDGVAAVEEDSGGAVDEGDRRVARGGGGEAQ